MERCFVCRTYTEETIRVEGRISRDVVQVCSAECAEDIVICVGCGFQSTDRVCSEECAHEQMYGTTHPDRFVEETPALDPPWYANR